MSASGMNIARGFDLARRHGGVADDALAIDRDGRGADVVTELVLSASLTKKRSRSGSPEWRLVRSSRSRSALVSIAGKKIPKLPRGLPRRAQAFDDLLEGTAGEDEAWRNQHVGRQVVQGA